MKTNLDGCLVAMPGATGLRRNVGHYSASMCAVFLLLALLTTQALAGETVLHSFNPYGNGAYPQANVYLALDGMLYGTTTSGGSLNAGTVWRVDPTGRQTVLYNFTGGADGGTPYGSLISDAAGNLYGTTSLGGTSGVGTVFKLDRRGRETVLYSFTGGADGGYPYYGLVWDPAGNLYGTANYFGAYNAGVVFKIDTRGRESTLYTFTGGTDGAYPNSIIRDLAGNIYGTTSNGGTAGQGVVFKLDRRGNETALYSFTGGADGGFPTWGVAEDWAGNFYGTTVNGGSAGVGVVFKLDPRGNETVLYSFTGGADGASPFAGVTLDLVGNLYGATGYGGSNGFGVIFKLDRQNHETVVHTFTGGADGGHPYAGVILDLFGNLYGNASSGGTSNLGAIYKIDHFGREAVLYGFPATDGSNPQAGVVQDAAGNLYGAATSGGLHGAGTVFKIDASNNYSTLYNFTGGTDGSNPFGGVILNPAGGLYGVAGGGGSFGAGLIYKMDEAGNETVLYAFTGGADGAYPNGIVADSAGNLYGTTADGGSNGIGVVFKIDPSGNETVLHTFAGLDGRWPYAGVTLDSAGNIYGTTFYGGSSPLYGGLGVGVVYKIDAGGNFTLLHDFTYGADGGQPWGDLMIDSAGNLYGTTWSGGSPSGDYPGVAYKIDTSGNFSVLYSFTGFSDGGGSRSNLVLDSMGNLYGTTEYGGIGDCPYFGCGVLFELNPAGQQTVLYSFSGGSDGSEPGTGLIRDAAGALYGTTFYGGANGAGAVYKVTSGGNSPNELQTIQDHFQITGNQNARTMQPEPLKPGYKPPSHSCPHDPIGRFNPVCQK